MKISWHQFICRWMINPASSEFLLASVEKKSSIYWQSLWGPNRNGGVTVWRKPLCTFCYTWFVDRRNVSVSWTVYVRKSFWGRIWLGLGQQSRDKESGLLDGIPSSDTVYLLYARGQFIFLTAAVVPLTSLCACFPPLALVTSWAQCWSLLCPGLRVLVSFGDVPSKKPHGCHHWWSKAWFDERLTCFLACEAPGVAVWCVCEPPGAAPCLPCRAVCLIPFSHPQQLDGMFHLGSNGWSGKQPALLLGSWTHLHCRDV